MKRKINNIEVDVPFWYHLNKKNITDFFENKITKIFKKEFMEWEKYEKKIKEIEDFNFKESLK